MNAKIVFKLIMFFSLMIVSKPAFPENLLLKNGQIFRGDLASIEKDKISMIIEGELYDFYFKDIEYLIAGSNQPNYSNILIKRKNGVEENASLIKMTDSALYFKHTDQNELKILRMTEIDNIKVKTSVFIATEQKNTVVIDSDVGEINEDLDKIIARIVNNKIGKNITKESVKDADKTSALENIIKIDSADFYDKFWLKINKYLDNNSTNLLWNLLENYSEKEKLLNIIYNEKLTAISKNKSSNAEFVTAELKNKIRDLRNDFYKRAKKIILSAGQ
ncbi:MAG TPA: hypothetical protein PK385_00195 [Spirochaetota bacterium]|nr:hypothetical protein [Spirochaetota bacterium]HOS31870.1 hypothetical protein [Spirochaetota bacterium]HOS54457.1 hypothetical protein [Spirochaetota bacterium]HPK62370.1 hypothetical protein [Spirochaetota bacterium]HQF76950.1 hypothetical protein [Spirochaetota bacterium]